MQNINEILGGIGLIWILFNAFYDFIDKGWLPNAKPFNCSFCISFWVTAIIFTFTPSWEIFIIPIIYQLLTTLIKRI